MTDVVVNNDAEIVGCINGKVGKKNYLLMVKKNWNLWDLFN